MWARYARRCVIARMVDLIKGISVYYGLTDWIVSYVAQNVGSAALTKAKPALGMRYEFPFLAAVVRR